MRATVSRIVDPFLSEVDQVLGSGYSAVLYGSAARDEGAKATLAEREFRRPDVAGRTIFSAPPVPGPSATRAASGAPGAAYWQQRADYTIEADVVQKTLLSTEGSGICGRMDTTAATYYMAGYLQSTAQWTLTLHHWTAPMSGPVLD